MATNAPSVNLSELRGQLINYEVYQGNTRLLGTATIDLPEIKPKTATLSGAGILGEIDMPTPGHTESMTLTLNWRSINTDLTALSIPQAVNLTLYGAEHLYNHSNGTTSAQQVKISVRGIPKTSTLGKFEPANTTDSKNEIEILYMQILIANFNAFEYDKLNNVYKVNGTDYYQSIRTALGTNGATR